MSQLRRAAVLLLLGATAPSALPPRAAADTFVQAAALTGRGGSAGDELGFAVAATPDGSTLVAGAPVATIAGHRRQGAVYVFVRGHGGWREAQRLTAPGGAAGDLLGISVAVSNDGATIVAGAQGAGAAYVFGRAGTGWTDIAKLTAAGGASGDYLGTAAGISADGSTIVAGADQATVGGTFQQGAAYVFTRPPGGWGGNGTQAAELTASNGGQSDYLGYSVAISGDGSTIVAGAPFAAVASLGGQGALYAFIRPPGGWGGASQPQHEARELTAADGVPGDALGVSVASSGDGSTLAAGAVGATVLGHPSQGALYVYADTHAAKLTAARGGTDHDLGGAVASLGDASLIGGGAPGAPASDHRGQGLLELFRRPASGWRSISRVVQLTDLDTNDGGHLGASLALAAGGAVIIAGAPGEVISKRRGQGAVYVFTRSSRASSATALRCRTAAGSTSCTATVIDTRDAYATGMVRLRGSGPACRLRPTRGVGVASCRLAVAPRGSRVTAIYGGDRLDLPSSATASLRR